VPEADLEKRTDMAVTADRAELSRSFRRGFVTLFGVDLINKGLTATTVVVLIRGLSVSVYAYATVLLTLAQFTTSAAAGGVLTRFIREESERLSRGGDARDERLFITSIAKSTLAVLAFSICALPVARIFGLADGSPEGLVLFAGLFALGWAITDLSVARSQAQRRFLSAGALSVVRSGVVLAASVLLILTAETKAAVGAWLAASTIVVGAITAGVIAAGASARGLARLTRLRFAREDALLSVYSLAAAGFAYVDVLVAAAMLDDHQVATLGAALRYWAVVLSAIPALGAVLRVRTSQVDIVDSPSSQRAMLIRWIRRSTIPAVLLIGLVAGIAPWAIPLVDGGKYPGSIAAFQVFLVTAVVAYVTAPAGVLLLAQRRYGSLALIQGLALLLNLVGDILVARRFGVLGIAVVSSTIYVAAGVVTSVAALRDHPVARTT
jgi:O-antigen/teichoic acid export membrane protein